MVTKTVNEMSKVVLNYCNDYAGSCAEILKVDVIKQSSMGPFRLATADVPLEDLPDKLCLMVTLSRESKRTACLPGLYEGVKVFYNVAPKENKNWTIFKSPTETVAEVHIA